MIRKACVVTLIVAWALHGQTATAAETYKEDDDIEVFFHSRWRPAKVVATNPRGEVVAEYEFAGGSQQRKFTPNEVRFAYESGALARSRMWSAASGKFKVKAALIGIEDNILLLRKPDLSEIKVAIDKLSDGDRSFLKKLEKQLGPIAPKAVEAEHFEEGTVFSAQAWLQPLRVALEPDPLPESFKMKQGGVVFPMVDFFDRLGGVLPLGGSDAGILAVVDNTTPSAPKPTRLVWASLDKQKIIGQQTLPGGEVVFDYHRDSRRLLTCSSADAQTGGSGDLTLTIWEVVPTDKQPKAVIRWLAQPDGRASHNPWARLLDGNTVLHRWKDQEYVVWDIKAKQLRYRLTQESFFSAPAALSGGKKYLVLPEDKRVRIVEAATGKLVSTIPTNNGSSGVAVSPDGVRLAVLDRNMLTIWDLTSADAAPEVHQAEAVGTPFAANIAWVSPDTIAVGNRNLILFSLKLKMALWNYVFDWHAVREESGRRVREIVDGHLVYAASVSRSARDTSLAVGAVTLPGPKVDEVAAQTTRESLLVVKPKSEVRLDVKAGEHQAQVEAALIKQIEQNGWVLRPDATIVMTAEMKRGETQSTTYTSRRDGATQSVTITPYVSTLMVKVGETVAWQSGTATGASPMMFLGPGQTAQGEADKWNHPNPKFFETVDIPDSILDPARRNGLGTTEVTNRGLVPKAN
jgi:hypothetical protein